MNRNYRTFAVYYFATMTAVAMMGVILFLSAWTVHYWQAWLLMAAMLGSVGLMILGCIVRHELLPVQRSSERSQDRSWSQTATLRIVESIAGLAFVALLILPGVDHRFGWSSVPPWVSLPAALLFAAGILITYRVGREKIRWSSAITEEKRDRQVISTGPFAVVRSPLQTGILLYQGAMPVALGSWWGLVPFAVVLVLNVVALLCMERAMRQMVPGYADYLDRVEYRLVPYVW
ncbi:methyltransferase family protein [Nocardia sp. NPDC049149]|uniref:methyltransferase family protein n=1 Tax=Nocardia sp. NPDC049149 TaxID=3364315 RepID=UPI00371C37C4